MEEQNLTTKKKKKWLLPTIIAVIVVIAAISVIAIYNLPANRRDRQLALAEKYMSELNYEAAILAYKAAIQIDPKNIEAYHGAVEAYSLAENQEGFEEFYTDALAVVEELNDEELDASIELVKDIYLTAPNVYDDNEKAAEVLEKGYEVTDNDNDVKDSLVNTYEEIIEDYKNDEKPDSAKILEICDRILELDRSNEEITDTRKNILEEYIKEALGNGNSNTAKELIDKYKELVPDIDYEKVVEDCINELFENEDYETVKKLADDFKNIFPDINLEDMLSEIETLEQEAAQKKALMLTVFDYMSAEDYDAMLNVDGSDEANAVRDILIARDKTSYIYIPDDDSTHTGTGVGIYLFGNGGYYFYYGDFIDGSREGNGCIFMKQGDERKYIFTGEWKEDAPNGYGNVYSESTNGTKNADGKLTNGLWNGHINCTWTVDNEDWDLSFDAVNGIPDEISEKEGYYSVIIHDDYGYIIKLGEKYYNAIYYIGNDIYTIELDASRYLIAVDFNFSKYLQGVYDSNECWYAYINYNLTYGIVGFGDTY